MSRGNSQCSQENHGKSARWLDVEATTELAEADRKGHILNTAETWTKSNTFRHLSINGMIGLRQFKGKRKPCFFSIKYNGIL